MPLTASRRYHLADHDATLEDVEYPLRVKDRPKEERPREKLVAAGVQSLTQAELLAVLWGVGTRKEDVLLMAKRTLQEYGDRAVFGNIKPAELAGQLAIPLTKACQLVAAFELGRRAYATGRGGHSPQIRTPRQAYHYFRDMDTNTKEQLRGLYLGSRHQVIHDEIISIGSLTSNIVHPREVFQPALEYGAVAVIIAHNHPSGSLEPSDADLEVTRQLVAAGKILGIDLLDHLIIAASGHQSVMQFLGQ
jgi:DNA repair protein RadC